MSHWYDNQAQLHAYVPNKSKGGMRDADLRDARKENWFPSVTTLLNLIPKPVLTDWACKQAIKEAAKYRWEDYATIDDGTVNNILNDSKNYVRWTQDFGSAVHKAMESLWKNNEELEVDELDKVLADIIPFPELQSFQDFTLVNPVAEETYNWMIHNGFEMADVEVSFVNHRMGWGGTVDGLGLHYGDPCIWDIKTQDAEDIGDFNHWTDHPIQVAGYALGLDLKEYKRVEVYTSRIKPGVVAAHVWDNNSLNDKKMIFLAQFWRVLNNYDPRPRRNNLVQGKMF